MFEVGQIVRIKDNVFAFGGQKGKILKCLTDRVSVEFPTMIGSYSFFYVEVESV